MPQSICLNMIVKDEEHVIESTLINILENVPITTWIISDTGSSDNTKKVISSFFKKRKIKGKIFDDEWKDFGHNRSKALEHAYDKSDYLLIFDADDSFSGKIVIPDNLTHDGYHLTFGSADYAYKRILLVNNRKRWKFEGVLHEYIAPIDHTPSFGDILGNYSVNSGKSGARSKDPDKYKKDALILEKAYYEAKSQNDDIYTRYGYYCAQSYHDARMKDEAIKWFKINLGDNGFIQEKVVSCIKLGDIYMERKDIAHAIYYWSKSLEVDNERFEGIYRIMQYYFNIRNFNMVINYYLMVCDQLDSNIPLQNKLFVDRTVYYYEIAWTVLLSAFYSNKPGYAIGAYKQLLKTFHRIPPERINDVFNNFQFYKNEIRDENITFFNKFQSAVDYVHINYPGIVKRESLHSLYASIETLLNPYKVYPKQITQTLTKCISSTNTKMNTVFTITSCKRLDLFTQTMNSFMQNCTDISSISFFLCVDDNSSDKDRETMQRLYPFMHFYLKGEHEKGHRESMNIIWNKLDELNPKYWMHMEDDWFFIKKEKYIERSINALHQLDSENVSQILFNRNYAEEFSDNAQLCGGKRLDNNLLLHIHNEEGLTGPNSAYWPHYSFRPSLIRWTTIKKLGNYDSQNQFFEKDYADKYTESGYKSAFYDEITCLHTGKLTRERDDPSKKNAYQLNGENQFDKASPTPKENKPNEPMIKVINLERRPDRKKDIEDKFKTAEIVDYEFVTALNGNELEPSEELSKLFNGNDFGSRCGVIGCALSHYYLWKEFIAASDREFIVIMEDDFNLTTNFKQHLSSLEERMNKENILFLGYSMFDDRRATVRDLYDVTSDTIVVSSLNKDLYMGGTFAYSINKKGAEFMVKYIEDHGIKHGIDYIIKHNADSPCECRPHIVFSPVCNGTNGVDSDIQTSMKRLSLDMIDYDKEYIFYKGMDYHGSDCEFMNDKSVNWLKREVFYRTDGVGFNTLGFIKNHIDLDNLKPSPYFSDNDGIYVKKKFNERNKQASGKELNVNTYFDKVFYINLDESQERNRNMLDIFSRTGITNYERVSACNVNDARDSGWELPTVTGMPLIERPQPEEVLLRKLACKLSHFNVISIAKERNYDRVLILEDDIEITESNIERLNRELKIFDGISNDWDFLYLFMCGGFQVGPHITSDIYKVEYTCGSQAFALNMKNADKILYDLENTSKQPLDDTFCNVCHKHCNVYVIRPYLVSTGNFDSTIDVSTDDACQENTKVKMLCDWCSSDDLCKEWNNMRGNQDVCSTFELVSNSEQADYFVIINKPQKDDHFDPKRTIVFQMEPWVYDDNKKWGVKTWGEWAEPDESEFLYVGTHKKALNAVQWWVRDYPMLFPVERKDRVISMISNKLCDDGHIKRLHLSKQCDLVDIFGRVNYHNIDKYKGPLKDDKKESEYVNYKYCLSIENNFEKNYATEKIWDGIMCECLCFYWGCPNLEDYIDSNAFIRLDLDNIEDSIKIIQKAIDEDWWTQRIDTIRKEKERLVNELGFFPMLEKLIATKAACREIV